MKHLLINLLMLLFLSSCTINSHIMLKTKYNYLFDEIDPNENPEYKIASNDVVDFRLYTNDGFQLIDMVSTGKVNNQANIAMLNFIKYNIRQDSLVELPIIGDVNLVGKTIKEAEDHLENIYSQYYVDPYINLKINSRRVFIFSGKGGDAKVLPLTYNNTTLIEALASIGGISTNGKAKRIKLIRQTELEPKIYLIDLSTIGGIKDGSIILQSHDIIYVQPNLNFASEILSDISPVLTLISTASTLWATYFIINQ